MNGSFDLIYFVHFDKTHCIMAENFIFAHKCTFVDQSKRKQLKSWHSTNLSTNHKTALQTILHSWTLDWLKILLHWLSGKLAYLWKYVCVNRRSSCPKKIHITGIDLKKSVLWKVIYNRSVISLLLNIRNMTYCISPWYSETETIIIYSTFCFRKMQHLA